MPKVTNVLESRIESYTKDGVAKSFRKYFVKVNGIEMNLIPADNTVRQVLESIFATEQE